MRAALLAVLLGWLAAPGAGETLWVSPGQGLQAALDRARPGDTVRVQAGRYAGPIEVRVPVRLEGQGRPVIDGGGQGTVVRLAAPGTVFRGFEVRGSGIEPDRDHSGITLCAPGIVVEDNRLEDVLFGIFVERADRAVLRRNRVGSKQGMELARKGDGIRLWYSQDCRLEENLVRGTRDVVAWYSSRLVVTGNRIEQGRYGIHFMYCDGARVERNDLRGNSVGIYTMYSRDVELRGNRLQSHRGASGYGLGFKDADDVRVLDNLLVDNRAGVFLDGTPLDPAARAEFRGNILAYNDRGVALLPSVRGCLFTGNTLWENGEQVAVEGGGQLGQSRWEGNYWSDYPGFDADGDGRGDLPYRSEKLFENLADRHPELRLFSLCPAQHAVDLAARLFPVVRPQPRFEDPSPALEPLPLTEDRAAPAGGRGGALAWAPLLLLGLALGALRARPCPVAPSSRGGAPMGDTLVFVQNLSKHFGAVQAAHEVTFELSRGRSVALWGANGAGKTTILRCILGLYDCRGTIRIGPYDVRRQGKQARGLMGYVPQELRFHDELSVLETLELYAALKEVPLSAREALHRVGLEGCEARRVGALSGGMKQRLALALALLGDPPLLLLDEPTSNLDLQGRDELLKLLVELKRSGKTLLFSSHRPDEVQALAERVVVLDAGRVQAVSSGLPVADLERE